jgi:hypothetical protein
MIDGLENCPNIKAVNNAFSKFSTEITQEQFNIINYFWGIDFVKTEKEMKSLLLDL